LQDYGIEAERKKAAPGVYVKGEKIAALGVRVRKGGTYHGLALNVDMDLSPFNGINPCGYADLVCTQIANHVSDITMEQVKKNFPKYLIQKLDSKVTDVLSDVA